MNKWLVMCVVAMFAVGFVACGPQEATAPETPAESGDTAEPASEPAAMEEPAEEPAAMEEPAEGSAPAAAAEEEMTEEPAEEAAAEEDATAPEGAASLANTTWTLDEYTITFYEAPSMHVEGGLAGAGINGDYELDGDALSISVGGMDLAGTYNGGELVIDGNAAVPAETEEAPAEQ